jgi:general secretion pathway protein A
VVGANGRPAFTSWAIRSVFNYSGGIPRLVNAVCDKALLAGFVEGTDRLSWKQVRRAIRELEGKFT